MSLILPDKSVLIWRKDVSAWTKATLRLSAGGTESHSTPGVYYWRVPSNARWAKVEAKAGDGSGGTSGRSVKLAGEIVAQGNTGPATLIEKAYDLTGYTGGLIAIELTNGSGDALITVTW